MITIKKRNIFTLCALSLLLCIFFFIFANCVENIGLVEYADAKTNISKAKITHVADMTWTGSQRKAKPVVKYKNKKLKLNKDYKLSYKSNVKPGTAKVIITGIGKYKSKTTRKYRIKKRSVNSSKLSVTKVSMQAYSGKSIKPSVTLKYKGKTLKKNKNYTISYSNNKKVGTATITIKGKGSYYTGKRIIKFSIRYSLKKGAKITLARTSMPYTGSNRKPYVYVKYGAKTLTYGKEYKLSYSNCKNVGTAKVTATGIGIYGFSISASYKVTYDGGKVIDLSEWNTVTSFTKMGRKVDLAILRSWVEYSDHSGNRSDNKYHSFASGCQSAKIPYGAYGYMNFTSEADARKQADAFYKASYSNGHSPLFLVLDIEDSYMIKKAASKTAQYTLAAIQQLWTHNPKLKIGLYIGNHIYKKAGFVGSDAESQASFIWIPTYGNNDGTVPTKYKPSYPYDMWQYTSQGSVSGVSSAGGIDLSRIYRKGPKAHHMGWYLTR